MREDPVLRAWADLNVLLATIPGVPEEILESAAQLGADYITWRDKKLAPNKEDQ